MTLGTLYTGTVPPAVAGVLGHPWSANPAAPPPPPAATTTDQQSARGIIDSVLREFGLSGLGDTAWQQFLTGIPIDTVLYNLRSTPEWQTRFKAIVDFQKAHPNVAPPSETDVVNYERTASQMFAAAGLPSSFYDQPDDFSRWIAGNVSPVELQKRVDLASRASYSAPPEDLAYLATNYGVGPGSGAMTAFFLDPDKALPLLQRDFQAGTLGGAAARTGFGALSRTEAERLAAQGVSGADATQGFGALASQRELFHPLNAAEDTITRQEQLGAAFSNDAAASARIRRRAEGRVAAINRQGGQFASTNQGNTGLSSAST